MSEDRLIEIIRIFVENRVDSNNIKSKIIVDNNDYDKANKLLEKYDQYKLLEVQKKERDEKNKKNKKQTDKYDTINILPYTDNSFVVLGNTTSYKDVLTNLGGIYTNKIKHPLSKEKLKGWVFSNRKLDKVKEELNLKK